MRLEDFGKKTDLSFELYGVIFCVREVTFGEALDFQKSLRDSYDITSDDETYKNLNISTISAQKMTDFIVSVVQKVEGLEDSKGKAVTELTEDIVMSLPAELINEIFTKINECLSGEVENKKK